MSNFKIACLCFFGLWSCTPVASNQQTKISFPTERLLFIGQDLNAIEDYKSNCKHCPAADGYVTYLNVAQIRRDNNYGGLGFTKKSQYDSIELNWGAGPLNAYTLAKENRESSIQIGLYMVDQGQKILSGQLDREIQHLGKFFLHFPDQLFYLRIGYEFDGRWNRYNANEYKLAYRYLVDALRKQGVFNVQYVWHSCTSPVDDILDGYHENIEAFYPGDNYVDWMGLSWFLRPSLGPEGSTQLELAEELVAFATSKNKPVMIAESSNQGYNNSEQTRSNISPILDGNSGENTISKTSKEIWEEWYAPYFTFIEHHSSTIRAISYINANWEEESMWSSPYQNGYWGDSRIGVNDTLRQYWIKEFQKPYWQRN